ncbi:hypothetical protein OP594_002673 [Enterococcus faecalis]|uniref:hypothetical protein n=1 Tax=Enterococcus faecalis TaxID=1351 RepID=UPI001159B91E|nr:hypothetical protein [Enterococcus faecalis]HAY6579041.1 hypothetical protein [Staphylococcus aureus]EKC6627183.1 hypothetical protein [Enterococcus faecalis]EKC6645014.1 hypothetical protein [Enterococcus faecalis]EKC6780284.1 hypothetical protein [Enterococcus faecalis]EKC6801419.1 hypothetical protein [Enterococcus faecalis]
MTNTTVETKSVEQLKEQARNDLHQRGLVVEGIFEGDFETYIGCYARPLDKPTALDPMNEKEAQEQAKYAVNGFPQDFAEWFEWDIVNGELENFS